MSRLKALIFIFALALSSVFAPNITAEASGPVWHQAGGQWYLQDEDGSLLTGWQKVGNKWYYLGQDGVMATGWRLIDGKWYYMDSSGAMTTGWQKIGGKWYFSDGNGAMVTGWRQINSKWYYFTSSGSMWSGWGLIDGKWYYMNSSGAMMTGWQEIDGKWYLFDGSGAMMTGWQKTGGKWYFLTSSGSMWTGWGMIGGKWYCMDGSGAMMTGWQKLSGRWYYFGSSGAMVSGSQTINNKSYLFSEDGILQTGAGRIVVLDPGHSSKVASGTVPLGPGSSERKDADSLGTRGVVTKVREYELNLTMSFKIQKELQLRGYTVYLTRTDSNSPLDCIKRAQIAADKNADIFVRIHANNDPRDASRTGAMTICITQDNPYHPGLYSGSYLLSSKLLDSYVAATGCRKEEVWETDTMTGNNWSTVPATLIELGYMSNAAEDRKMQDSAYQAKMAQGVADGIDAYFEAVQ